MNDDFLSLISIFFNRFPIIFNVLLSYSAQLQSVDWSNTCQKGSKQQQYPTTYKHLMILYVVYYRFIIFDEYVFKIIIQIISNIQKTMIDFLEDIRTHFNILVDEETLSLTLINPNITAQVMTSIKNNLTLISNLTSIDIVIIQCPNFDDELLTILSKGLPRSLKQLSLDFTGCQSLRGEGFLQLFQNLDGLQLTKLSLDLGSLLDINDIVIQGLTLLLSNLTHSLQQFYLDLYEVDQITQDGYLLLSQTISQLANLKKLHIDLSANQYLTQDSLEILFSGEYERLTYFSIKILDTEQIGGGSFFKLAQSLGKMTLLEELSLTISTFSNLNHKGTYSIIRSIGKIPSLKKLHLNLSNIELPEKILTYLNICPSLQEISLDISCNRNITFGDFINLGTKIKKVKKIELNLDFCTNITQDVIEEVITMVCNQNKCFFLTLSDRIYSPQFQSNIIPILMQSTSLLEFNLSGTKPSKKLLAYNKMLRNKKHLLWIVICARAKNHPYALTRAIMQQMSYNN